MVVILFQCFVFFYQPYLHGFYIKTFFFTLVPYVQDTILNLPNPYLRSTHSTVLDTHTYMYMGNTLYVLALLIPLGKSSQLQLGEPSWPQQLFDRLTFLPDFLIFWEQ